MPTHIALRCFRYQIDLYSQNLLKIQNKKIFILQTQLKRQSISEEKLF